MKDGRINKIFRKLDCDIIFRDGRIFYLEEEMTEEKPIEELFEPFEGSFCKLSITNEVKYDTLEVEEE